MCADGPAYEAYLSNTHTPKGGSSPQQVPLYMHQHSLPAAPTATQHQQQHSKGSVELSLSWMVPPGSSSGSTGGGRQTFLPGIRHHGQPGPLPGIAPAAAGSGGLQRRRSMLESEQIRRMMSGINAEAAGLQRQQTQPCSPSSPLAMAHMMAVPGGAALAYAAARAATLTHDAAAGAGAGAGSPTARRRLSMMDLGASPVQRQQRQ